MSRRAALGVCVLVAWGIAACDTAPSVESDVLVVEAFFDVGQALPAIRVQRTAPLGGEYPGEDALAVSDATVAVTADGIPLTYGPSGQAGVYTPADARPVAPGVRYRVEVAWRGERAVAETRTPPRLALTRLAVEPFSAPIRAVLLDSLRFDTLGTGARQGFVYPVEVVATWAAADAAEDSLLWLRAQLRPAQGFSSTVVDFFFPPERIQPERELVLDGAQRTWRGLYVLPVDSATAPLPRHRLRVALVRSGQDYARFAATRTAPVRREPRGNVVGGRGIVAGLSVDSLVVEVAPHRSPGGHAPR